MRETFEEALQANWDDLATHHAFADWMTDEGDPRGELAHCQLLLETPSLTPQQRLELQRREQALLTQHQKAWLGNLIPKPPPRLGNVRKLVVGQPADRAAPYNSDPAENTCFPDALLALASRLPRLEHLSIAQIHADGELAELFSLAGPLPALRELELYYLPFSDVSRLLQCPSLLGVRRLTLHASLLAHGAANNTTFYNLAWGIVAPHLASLEALSVHREARGDGLLTDLTSSPLFGRLRELVVVCSRVTDAGAEALLGARPQSALRALDLSFGVFSPSLLQRLRGAYPFMVAREVLTPEEHLGRQQQAAAAAQQTMQETDWE